MGSYDLNVIGEAITLAGLVASIFGACCWSIEKIVGRQVGVYAGYIAIAVVVLLIGHQIHASLECLGVSPSWCDPHDWLAYARANATALTLLALPLLVVSEIKLRRWSRNRVQPTH